MKFTAHEFLPDRAAGATLQPCTLAEKLCSGKWCFGRSSTALSLLMLILSKNHARVHGFCLIWKIQVIPPWPKSPKCQGSKLPRLAAVQTGVDVKGEVGAVQAQALFCSLRVWKDCPFPGTQVCWMDLQCLFQLGISWVKSALLNTGVRDLCRMNQFSSTF